MFIDNRLIFSFLKKEVIGLILFMNTFLVLAQLPGKMNAIYSGTPWFDQNENVVSAHGANIIKEKRTIVT